MKKIICLLLFFLSITAFSQQKAFEITNIKSGKVKIYEENQRVKIRTLDGKKTIGNLHFTDDGNLLIDSKTVKIDSLLSIKSNPKVLGTVKTVVLFTGLAVVASSLIVASAGGNAAFLLFTTGAGITIAAGVLEAVNTNNSNRKWTFKIIEK